MDPNKKRKKKAAAKSVAQPSKTKLYLKWMVLIVAIAAAAAGLIIYQLQSTEPDPKQATVADQSTAGPAVEFDKLVGRWLRPDGGYIIEIRNIQSGGKMEAAYLNPRSINVSQARASRKSGGLEVFIELRDQGYPGSSYTLIYHPQQDMMTGIYYQAAMSQSFEVMFVRAK